MHVKTEIWPPCHQLFMRCHILAGDIPTMFHTHAVKKVTFISNLYTYIYYILTHFYGHFIYRWFFELGYSP